MKLPASLATGLLFTAAVMASAPARAQDHSAHADSAPVYSACEEEAERHRAMGHPVPEGECEPFPTPAQDAEDADMPVSMDHGTRDHSQMNHSQMDHSAMDHEAISPIETPPPASAGSGAPRAADAIWGAEAMRESRQALRREHGGMRTAGLTVDRLEYRTQDGRDGFLWDVDGWYGGDLERVWIESEGEGAFGAGVEEADLALLYGRAISPWFDLQAGIRQDLTGPARTYLDIGVQGLAPYFLEVEADAYLSTRGDLTAVVEAELDQRITQRLILQPRAEVALAAQDVPELGIGAGLDSIELGLRLRYEFAREFAPYIGIEQEWKLGGSADFARAAGENSAITHLVAGLRFWF